VPFWMWLSAVVTPPCPFLLFLLLSFFVATLATLFLLEELEALPFSFPFSFRDYCEYGTLPLSSPFQPIVG
jgi:hypothetical protein